MKDIDKIYIIHYTKLGARKTHMQTQMETWFPDISHEFVEDFDQEKLSSDIISDNFDLETFEKKFERKMLISEMSLCMKYKKAVSDIVESDQGEYFFILEDDVIFKEDPIVYVNKMNKICRDHNLKYDCVFLGEAWIRKGDDRDIFGKKDHPATNGLCTVLYTREALKKLNNYLQSNKITQPLDWEFNTAFEKMDFQVYWGKALTKHGSVLAVDEDSLKHLKSSLRDSY
tara:strand:+ start:357 stop:1043 length:687 start_codon:yes stop_codon:yes gene_type:complete